MANVRQERFLAVESNAVEPAPRSPRTAIVRFVNSTGMTVLVYVGLVVAWQIAVDLFQIPRYILPGPIEILLRLLKDLPTIMGHTLVTLNEVLLGFALSVAISVPLGMLIVYSPIFERLIYPLLVSTQAIPKVALAPIFVVWFGFGITSKVLIAFLVAFFPIVINTVVGMSRTPQELLYLMDSLGASSLQTFLKVRLPTAAPYIFGGFKVAVSLAVVGAVVGEFIAANNGLGYLQLVANSLIDMTLLFSTVLVLSLMGIILFYAVSIVESFVVPKSQRKVQQGPGTGGM